VVNQDAQPQMTGGLISHADLEARFTTIQLANKKEEGPTEEQMETVYRNATSRNFDTKAEEGERGETYGLGKGIVQRDETEKAIREMELERGKGFERYVAVLVLNELN
jgi:pre-mRNA-splicing factor CWC26